MRCLSINFWEWVVKMIDLICTLMDQATFQAKRINNLQDQNKALANALADLIEMIDQITDKGSSIRIRYAREVLARNGEQNDH